MGKRLYTDFFFNHQPLPAYISWAIQSLYQPQSIYELVYRHRMVLIYYFVAADLLLTLRFGLAGFAFAVLYETTKGYVFGERFLAESMVVYPLVYLFGLSILPMLSSRPRNDVRGKLPTGFSVQNLYQFNMFSIIEAVLAATATWFVVFSREPYVPLALFLFGVYLWRLQKGRALGLAAFAILSAATILIHNPAEYWWNVVVASARSVAGAEIQANNLAGVGLLSIFFYPIQVLFGGTWNHFRWIEAMLSVLFLVLLAIRLIRFRIDRNKAAALTLSIVLVIASGLANIRQVAPGTLYYGAFHHMVWYALAIAAVAFFVLNVTSLFVIPAKAGIQHSIKKHAIQGTFWLIYAGIVVYALFSPQSYLREKVDRAAEFGIGYSHYSTQGEIIRRLSLPTHTMFVEEWDELIYWQAKRPPAYRYVWWSSTLADEPKYRDAKESMWQDSPPDFYVGLCDRDDPAKTSLPITLEKDYLRLTQNGKPSCLFVRRTVAGTITDDQWKSALDFSVDTPSM
ncbi:hypothetical protein HY411_01545 [Candidatus Gottesmanbacteria bacterium]|nr:hypothetical protein [Candidatus Gottesmanbacteria bacterium]